MGNDDWAFKIGQITSFLMQLLKQMSFFLNLFIVLGPQTIIIIP